MLFPSINNRLINLTLHIFTAVGIFYSLMTVTNVWFSIYWLLNGVIPTLSISYTIVNGVIAYGFFRRSRWLIAAFTLNITVLLWHTFVSAASDTNHYMFVGSLFANALILFLLFRERHSLTNTKLETAICSSLFVVFWLIPQVYYT